MNTFFATLKAGKSSRGKTCCQPFVSDKGFVFVVQMKRRSKVPLALNLFDKEIGSQDAIICDAAGEQKSKEVQKLCH